MKSQWLELEGQRVGTNLRRHSKDQVGGELATVIGCTFWPTKSTVRPLKIGQIPPKMKVVGTQTHPFSGARYEF